MTFFTSNFSRTNGIVVGDTTLNRKMDQFIVASSKPWHKPLYDELCIKMAGVWTYVTTPEELTTALTAQQPRYIFFLHWNWLVPEKIWTKCECVCFHMTDVPYGRGGSPLQNLILAGHTHTQLTALKMVRDMDAGPVYTKRPMQLDGSAREIYERAGKISFELIEWIISNQPTPSEQEGDPVIFKRRKPEQSVIPENGSLRNIYDFIRMLDAESYPAAFIEHGDFLIKFKKATMRNDKVIAEVEIKLKNNL